MQMRDAALSVALGLVFFLITATTFASLGVLLPAMIAEFGWSWTTAGLGFTMLALLTGVFSPIAAASLERLGPRFHYLVAGSVMTAGYALLGAASGATAYLAATALLGAGFAMLANVPGTYLVGRTAPSSLRNVAIGAYLAAGGAGGVLGPLMANAIMTTGEDWRLYWRFAAIAMAIASVIVVLLAERRLSQARGEETPDRAVETSDIVWTPRDAIRTAPFIIVAGALTIVYFCGVTVSTWSVAHLQNAGLPSAIAVSMLSLYAAVNAFARAAGGVAVRFLSAKTLLIIALLGNVVGMIALTFAKSLSAAIVFAVFDGFAFGMALFATTAILIDYFGLRNSPALLGAANLAATTAMLGPTIAGQTADRWGGFAPIFLIYAGGAFIAAIAVATIQPPTKRP